MSEQVWRLGQEYRDTASVSNPEDQFLAWLKTAAGTTINNSSGIRSLRFSTDAKSEWPHACIVIVSSDMRNPRADQWIDPLPDYKEGVAWYWGDAQLGDTKPTSDWPGNRILLAAKTIQHAQVLPPTPVLMFSKPASGKVKFLGLAAIKTVDEEDQLQAGGQPVRNLKAALEILDCEQVDAEWIRQRAIQGPAADRALGPDAWRSLIDTGQVPRISLEGTRISELGLPTYPDTVLGAFRYLDPSDVVTAIRRFDHGESGQFHDSTKWDLVHEQKPYPPKAICGLAVRRILGRDGLPSEFSGGRDSECFAALKRLGFDIRPKDGVDPDACGILLTWNQERWPWTELRAHIAAVRAGDADGTGDETGKFRWSVGNRREIVEGTRFFLIKLGQTPKGIMGSGWTASPVYEDTHFDPNRAAAGQKARYVKLKWETLLDPHADGVLDVATFNEPELTSVRWSSQQSGINIPPEALSLLEDKWHRYLHAETEPAPAPRPRPVPYTIESAMEDLFLPRAELERMVESLRTQKNIILQGPPGVGKSFLARRLAYLLLGEKDKDRVEMVQFHQAYAYEDFVQGFRPSAGGFKRTNGTFYRFCRSAAKDPAQRGFVFIIDEINRGNLAAILGELMLLIERDKRGPDFAIPLTYSSEQDRVANPDEYRFYVPTNLHVIGLMNTADRSLAMVDYALRRRFRFFSLLPRFNDEFVAYLERCGADPSFCRRMVQRLREVNDAIVGDHQNLGWGYQVGHSYFCPNPGQVPDVTWYTEVINGSIIPLLEEYFGVDDPDRLEEFRQLLLP